MSSAPRRQVALAGGALAVALIMAGCSSSGGTDQPAVSQPTSSAMSSHDAASSQAALRTSLHKLREDHITWTRPFIIAAEAGSPDTTATAARLLKNQQDIGDAIKPLYGDDAGTQLTKLLRAHILTAGDLIAEAKSGNTAKVATDKARWYASANEIADFLTKANPSNWPATAPPPNR